MALSEPHEALKPPTFETPPKLLIVAAPFYRDICDDLIAGARTVIDAAGGAHELVEVPGALEIPVAIRIAHRQADFDGFVALGCVIRGETSHYETVSNESAGALMLLGLEGAHIGNGILTVETRAQAAIRANPGAMDKGGGAAAAALHLIALSRKYAGARKGIGFRSAGGGLPGGGEGASGA